MDIARSPIFTIGITGAFFSFVLYFTQYGLIGQKLNKMFQWRNPNKDEKQIEGLTAQLSSRLTGSVHNIIQVPFAIYLLFDEALRKDPLHEHTPQSTLFLAITAGYFVLDLWICYRDFKTEGPLYFLHGFSCFTLYVYGTFSGFLHYYGAGFLLWEVSTPFVQAHWLLKHLHMQDTKAYFINGVIMLSTFFLFRCVWGTWLSISFWTTSSIELSSPTKPGVPASVIWLYRVSNVALNCLNFFWVSKMIRLSLAFLKANKSKTN